MTTGIQPKTVKDSFFLVTPKYVRNAAEEYHAKNAQDTMRKVSASVTMAVTHLLSLALFAHWYTSSVVANYAIGAMIAAPVVQKPTHCAANVITTSLLGRALIARARNEGVNLGYLPNPHVLAHRISLVPCVA